MTVKTAASDGNARRPAQWDKMVSAAYLRILGATQADAAKAVGRNPRTIREWEAGDLWQDALAEAEERWLVDLKHASMNAVLDNVKAGNAVLGFQVLERPKKELAPPRQRLEHTGKDGGPIEMAAKLAQVPDEELFRGRDAVAARAIGAA